MENSSPHRISVRLRCPVTQEEFEFEAPRSSGWLAAHWNRKSKVRCRECGGAHSYAFKEPVIESMLEAPRDARKFAAIGTEPQ